MAVSFENQSMPAQFGKPMPVQFGKQAVAPTPPASPKQSCLSLMIGKKNSQASSGSSDTSPAGKAVPEGKSMLGSCLTFACPKPNKEDSKFQRPLCGTPPPSRRYTPEEDEDEDDYSESDNENYDDNDDNDDIFSSE